MVFKIGYLGPILKYWRSSGSLRIPRNHKRGSLGPRSWALALSCPWGPDPRLVFSGGPEATTGSPVLEDGSQVANLENGSGKDVVEMITKGNKIDMASCSCARECCEEYHVDVVNSVHGQHLSLIHI